MIGLLKSVTEVVADLGGASIVGHAGGVLGSFWCFYTRVIPNP